MSGTRVKVVHVTSGLSTSGAGVRAVVMALSQAQNEQGLSVSVFGLRTPGWVVDESSWTGAPVQALRVFGPRNFGYAPSMRTSIIRDAPDVVHLHGLWMHPGRSVLQWHHRTGRPYIISPHGMLSSPALSYSRWKKKLVSAWFQDEVFRHASAVHVTSLEEARDVSRYGISLPIHVVPNGIGNLTEPVGLGLPRRVILSLGRIHPIKGLDQLILAWAKLADEFPEWSVQIVGPDQQGEVARLTSLIAEHEVKRVSIRGPVYGEDKIATIARAGVFVLPSLSENFGLTVAESLMLGVPVVASRGSPWRGLEEEGCGLWVPFGSKATEVALRSVLRLDDDARQSMGARGRAWMLREFSWTSVVERLSQCYGQAITSSR